MHTKRIAKKALEVFKQLAFDPIALVRKFSKIPEFLVDVIQYSKNIRKNDVFQIKIKNMFPILIEKTDSAGVVKGHYFHQDLYVAKKIFENGTVDHVDIGSRIDGFVSHLLLFADVTYVDIRNISSNVSGLTFKRGTLTGLPFDSSSLLSVSCLHVIEHVGLGRYGDPIDPDSFKLALTELARVAAPGGRLYLSVPVGCERLEFNAHRVFSVETVLAHFIGFNLISFALIDDSHSRILENASFETANIQSFGCGIFILEKI